MANYVGKPVKAWQVGITLCPDWVSIVQNPEDGSDPNYADVVTPKGVKRVYLNDWVIRCSDGTVITMKDAKFKRLYEAAPEQTTDPRTQQVSAQPEVVPAAPPSSPIRSDVVAQQETAATAARVPPAPVPTGAGRADPRPAVHKHKPGEYR